jgi:hypothetical protein
MVLIEGQRTKSFEGKDELKEGVKQVIEDLINEVHLSWPDSILLFQIVFRKAENDGFTQSVISNLSVFIKERSSVPLPLGMICIRDTDLLCLDLFSKQEAA